MVAVCLEVLAHTCSNMYVAYLYVLISGIRQRSGSESVTTPTASAPAVVTVLTVGQPPVAPRNLKILHHQKVVAVSGMQDSDA